MCKCGACGGYLYQRADDTEETVKQKLKAAAILRNVTQEAESINEVGFAGRIRPDQEHPILGDDIH